MEPINPTEQSAKAEPNRSITKSNPISVVNEVPKPKESMQVSQSQTNLSMGQQIPMSTVIDPKNCQVCGKRVAKVTETNDSL